MGHHFYLLNQQNEKMRNLINAVRQSLDERNWYAALSLVMTLPDIAGKVEYPNVTSSQRRFADWYVRYMQSKYTSSAPLPPFPLPGFTNIFLNGDDFYALRCSILHEGSSAIGHQRARRVLEDFQFIIPPTGSTWHLNRRNNNLQIQVDIFCNDVLDGLEAWLNDIQADQAKQNRLASFFFIQDLSGHEGPISISM